MSESLGRMMTGGANPKLRPVQGHPKSARARAMGEIFDTPREVTTALLGWVERREPIAGVWPIWEPFAGENAMVNVLRQYGLRVKASDINPRGDGIEQRDFFDFKRVPRVQGRPLALISNPPFSLAEDIIRHAFMIGVEQMALVLKATYWHAAERTRLFYQHRPIAVLALTWRVDFMNLGRPTTEVVWVVWDKAHEGHRI